MKKGWSRVARYAACALLLLVIAGIVTIVLWRISLEKKNRARLAAISAKGEPVDSIELNQSYTHVDGASNAALRWLEGFAQLSSEVSRNDIWTNFSFRVRTTNFPPDQVEHLRGLVQDNGEALAIFRQAATLPASRYPVNLTPGVNALLPHLTSLRKVGRMLQAEMIIAIEDGQPGRAADALATLATLGRSLDSEPILISQLTSYALDATAVSSADYLLNRTVPDEPALARLARAFAATESSNSLYVALVGERAIFASVMKAPQAFLAAGARPTSSLQETLQDMGFGLMRLTGFFERDFGFGMDALTSSIRSSTLPDPERLASYTNWQTFEAKARSGRYILSGLLLPALGKAVVRDTEDRARARLAQTAFAIERYYAREQRLPESLGELIPEFLQAIPIDPCDGQGIRYKQRQAGYLVYSVGADTRDDGGLEKPPRWKEKEPYDVTFIVERLKPR